MRNIMLVLLALPLMAVYKLPAGTPTKDFLYREHVVLDGKSTPLFSNVCQIGMKGKDAGRVFVFNFTSVSKDVAVGQELSRIAGMPALQPLVADAVANVQGSACYGTQYYYDGDKGFDSAHLLVAKCSDGSAGATSSYGEIVADFMDSLCSPKK